MVIEEYGIYKITSGLNWLNVLKSDLFKNNLFVLIALHRQPEISMECFPIKITLCSSFKALTIS